MTNLGRYYQDTNYGLRVEVRTMPAGEVASTHGAEGVKNMHPKQAIQILEGKPNLNQ